MRDNRRFAITTGIIEFFQKGREKERTYLWQTSIETTLPARLENELRASSDLEFSSSHNNNNSRENSAPELNLKFKQNGDRHRGEA